MAYFLAIEKLRIKNSIMKQGKNFLKIRKCKNIIDVEEIH